MKKNFTAEEIKKCHSTNVKASGSLYLLAGVLCLVYIARYFITHNFNFYFSLAVPDMLLKLGDSGEMNTVLSVVLAAVFMLVYFIVGIAVVKKPKLFPLMTVTYLADTVCLFFCDFILWQRPQSTDFLIDIICHIWVLLFLVVGMRSQKALERENNN